MLVIQNASINGLLCGTYDDKPFFVGAWLHGSYRLVLNRAGILEINLRDLVGDSLTISPEGVRPEEFTNEVDKEERYTNDTGDKNKSRPDRLARLTSAERFHIRHFPLTE